MAAGFLITRILLIFLLSELDYSSAFPRARSYVYPEGQAWQGLRKKQEGYGYGNRRHLQYIQALRQPHRKLQPPVHGQVQVKTWQKPQGSPLMVRSHAQVQNQPNLYRQPQSLYQPLQRNHPLPKPRSFEFSIKVPFADNLNQNKGTSSTTKGSDLNSGGSDGSGHYSQLYRPSSIQIYTAFNRASGSDSLSDKGSTNYPTGGKTAHDVSKPSFQLSLSVPILPTTSPKHSNSIGGYLANLQRPESVEYVQNTYMEQPKPQSSLTQSGSERIFLNSASNVQQQTEQQTYEPIPTKYTDSTVSTFSSVSASQHTTLSEHISQGKVPTQQNLLFPEPSAPSLPIPQYSPLPSDNVYSGHYNAHINPLSNDWGKGQNGQTLSPDLTNEHLPSFPSQYESAPSGHYSAGQVKPNDNNYGQHQSWQPVSTPLTFASDQYSYDQFKPSFGQNIETVPQPTYNQQPSSSTAPSQYKPSSFYQDPITNYHGAGNVVQMRPTYFLSSSPHQYSRDQSGQDALQDQLTAVDPSTNSQALSNDYQTQMRLPGQDTGRGQLDRKPNYSKLYIDVENEMDGGDGQHNYFAAPPTHPSYPGTRTEQNMADSLVSVSQDQLPELLNSPFESYSNHFESYMPVYNQNPTMGREVGQYAYNPQKRIEKEQMQTPYLVPGQVNYAPHMGA